MSATATSEARAGTLSTVPAWPLRLKLAVKPNAYVGTLGVFLGAGLTTLLGRLLTVGLPDLRGALSLGVDEASWIPTAYNMALMFMGPFSVYLGALLGIRRVLLWAAPVFVVALILLPFSPNLAVMLTLQVIAGIGSGAFYPLTLTYALRALPISIRERSSDHLTFSPLRLSFTASGCSEARWAVPSCRDSFRCGSNSTQI